MTSITRKARDDRDAGNVAIEKQNYAKAIQIYTEELLEKPLSAEDKGILYSNRSYAHFMTALMKGDKNEAQLKSALRDAHEAINYRPTWWKGYFRAGVVHQQNKDWDDAIYCFDEALSIKKPLAEVRKARDECRFDKMREEMSDAIRRYGLYEDMQKVNIDRMGYIFTSLISNSILCKR